MFSPAYPLHIHQLLKIQIIFYILKIFNYNVLSINVIMSCFLNLHIFVIADTDVRAVVWLGCGRVGFALVYMQCC